MTVPGRVQNEVPTGAPWVTGVRSPIEEPLL
jgi:hypothetical protein